MPEITVAYALMPSFSQNSNTSSKGKGKARDQDSPPLGGFLSVSPVFT